MKKLIKRLFLISLIVLFSVNLAFAALIDVYHSYSVNDDVTNANLNGNINRIINEINGHLNNANMEAGYRLFEVLGSTPVAGNQGRIVYNTTDDILSLDTGSALRYWATHPSGQAQGDLLYHTGTNWALLPAGTSGYFLKTQGTGANPAWTAPTSTDLSIASQASGDLLYFNGTNWLGSPQNNVLYTWGGSIYYENITGDSGFVMSATNNDTTTDGKYSYIRHYGNTFQTFLNSKFVKTDSISTITVWAYLRALDTDANTQCKVIVGPSLNGTVITIEDDTTWHWGSATIDVSSLTNGTTYDISIQLNNESATKFSFLGTIVLLGS